MKIAVLTGGSSSERDVAFASAGQVVSALRSRGHTVTVADTTSGLLDAATETRLLSPRVRTAPPDRDTVAGLMDAERAVLFGGLLNERGVRDADVIFLGLHGGRGEDGAIQNLLELADVRYTGSGPVGSAIALDKDLSKKLFLVAEVLTAAWLMHPVTADQVDTELDWPVVVKPSREGSTVGLSIVREPGGLRAAVEEALRHDASVMIEAFVPGRELTVGILGEEALAVGEIIPRHEIFDYECKYTPGMTEEIFPARISELVADEARDLALKVHRALNLRGYSRVDFRMTDEGQLFCLEANTLPGMTATSLLPQSAAAVGIDFPTLCEKICELALETE